MKFLVDNMLMGATWVEEILQWIGMWIDAIVYNLLASFYNIFMAIVKIDLGDVNDMFDNLLYRIYLVLGLFMLFKISFNLLQMLVNPDKVNDSSIGGPAMAKNIFISLVMLVAFPLVFSILGDAQKAIIDNGIIEKVVLGDSAQSLSSNAAGPAFSWTLLSAFLHPADGTGWESANVSDKVLKAYDQVWDGYEFKLKQFPSVVTDSSVSYTPIVSSIVGIFMIFYLISFSFDVGARIFKLMFLEIIAPIPIISYMDPAKGKGVFDRYRDEYVSTYLELFIRLAIIYLALLLANKIMVLLTADSEGMFTIGNGAIQLNGLSLALAKVILVIAIFNFAKKVPDLINSVFGFKKGGSGGDNKGLITGALLGGAGVIGGAVIGGGGAAIGSAMRGEGFGRGLMNAAGGAARGAAGMGKAGWGTKSFSAGALGKMGGAAVAGVRRQGVVSEATTAAGGWWNMQRGKFDAATGGDYRAKRQMDSYDRSIESAEKDFQKAQGTMSSFESMRHLAEQEFAQQKGATLDEVRKNMGSDFDNNFRTWLGGNDAAGRPSTTGAFATAMENYNAQNGSDLSASTFMGRSNSATQEFQRTATALKSAKDSKKSWESRKTFGLGTNEDRATRRDAAHKAQKKG